jgi:hypothetical protein
MLYASFWVIARRLNYPEESIQNSERGVSLKSRIILQIQILAYLKRFIDISKLQGVSFPLFL